MPARVCALAAAQAWLLGCLLLLQALGATAAWAHATQLSASRIALTGAQASVEVELNAADLAVALRRTLLDAQGAVDERALRAAAGEIHAYLLAHAVLERSGLGPCRGEVQSLAPKREHVLAVVLWRCAPGSASLRYRASLFHEIDAASRHMVVARGDVNRVALLSVSTASVDLGQLRVSRLEVLRHYLWAGVEHILIGYDHLAFLLAVVVWARGLWPLVKVVSAFTVAHSITLALAVTGLVQLPTAWVELAIALSIVYVAAENFFVRDLRHRAWLTFAFGLVHGFGFASVLRDYGLPREVLLLSLAAFNVGVEIGQLAFVMLLLAAAALLLRALRTAKWGEAAAARLPLALSAAVLALGVYWTLARVAALA